jgi:hypothetical protein
MPENFATARKILPAFFLQQTPAESRRRQQKKIYNTEVG